MKEIAVATHNKGKLEEYKNYLNPLGYKVLSLDNLGITEEAPEEGESFLEVAENKAIFYSKLTHKPIVADDSGLEILALDGFPGVKTNRWMEGSDREKNIAIEQKMKDKKDRRATFKAIIVYKKGKTLVRFQGELSGEISAKPRGVMGFGYDPIFYLPTLKRTLGELLLFEKNQISHRAKALQKLVSYLKKYKAQ